MKLKVCGMRDPQNIKELIGLNPDFVGFIFYGKSPRYVDGLSSEYVKAIPSNIQKVGVFVKATIEEIQDQAKMFDLDYIQLHGGESVAFAREVKKLGLGVIKVFSVVNQLPEDLHEFDEVADYVLFDTATKDFGGSGKKFDWEVLTEYDLQTSFLLSGGIEVDDLPQIKKLDLPKLAGIDVNSKFEKLPGLKNIEKIQDLIMAI